MAQVLETFTQRQEAQQTLLAAVHQVVINRMVTLQIHFQDYTRKYHEDNSTTNTIDIDTLVNPNNIADVNNNIVGGVMELLQLRLTTYPLSYVITKFPKHLTSRRASHVERTVQEAIGVHRRGLHMLRAPSTAFSIENYSGPHRKR